MSQSVPDIIYIMGTGRSGSTILEILLANNPGIAGVGEVTHIFHDGYEKNAICSCGRPTSACSVWSAVRTNCRWPDDEIALLTHFFRSMSWHTRFPVVALNLVSSDKMRLYGEVNRCLFQAAGSALGAAAIVDSSKYAARAIALDRALPGKVKVICLTRSPRGLINAFQKINAEEQKPKSITATLFYYAYVMLCLRIAMWQLKSRVLHVRYEELVSDAPSVLSRIEKWSGYDLSSVRNKLAKGEMLAAGHIVTGNRLRRQGHVRFNPGTEIPAVRGNGARLAIWAMNLYRTALKL